MLRLALPDFVDGVARHYLVKVTVAGIVSDELVKHTIAPFQLWIGLQQVDLHPKSLGVHLHVVEPSAELFMDSTDLRLTDRVQS